MSYQTDIAQYFDIIKRRRSILIIFILFSLIIGIIVAFKIPPSFRSEAKIYYTAPQLPERMVVSFVSVYLEGAIKFIEATVLSRDNCIKIINEMNLYPDLAKKIPMDDLVSRMKDEYTSTMLYQTVSGPGVSSGQEMILGFKFSFDDRNPQKAFAVATSLATLFIEAYKKFRENMASTSSSFFLDEQQRLKEEIAKIDRLISDFKEKHVNELPELFQNNYQMVQTLNQQLLILDLEIRRVNDRKILLESQLATVDPFLPLEGVSGQKITTPEEKLASLKAELAVLQSTLSDRHPDIIRIKREIESLGKTTALEKDASSSPKESDKYQSSWAKKLNFKEHSVAYNPIYVNFTTQLEDADGEIKSYQEQKNKIKADIEKYRLRVENSAVVEREYNLFIRDRQSSVKRYEEVVNQALLADSSSAMEKKEAGGKLIISEPPNYPLRPIKPNRPLVIGISICVGVGLSLLIILYLEFLNQTIRSPQDLSKIAPFPILLELPELQKDQAKRINKIRKFSIPLIIILLVPVILFTINKFYRPLELDITFMKIINSLIQKFMLLGL